MFSSETAAEMPPASRRTVCQRVRGYCWLGSIDVAVRKGTEAVVTAEDEVGVVERSRWAESETVSI
jgi:hypothetical protein